MSVATALLGRDINRKVTVLAFVNTIVQIDTQCSERD